MYSQLYIPKNGSNPSSGEEVRSIINIQILCDQAQICWHGTVLFWSVVFKILTVTGGGSWSFLVRWFLVLFGPVVLGPNFMGFVQDAQFFPFYTRLIFLK